MHSTLAVKGDFLSRAAKSRSYSYKFAVAKDYARFPTIYEPFFSRYHKDFDLEKVEKVVEMYKGHHDFSAFAGSEAKFYQGIELQKSYFLREITESTLRFLITVHV